MTAWPRPDFLGVPPRAPLAARLFALAGGGALLAAVVAAGALHLELGRETRAGLATAGPGPSTRSLAPAAAVRRDDVESRRSARQLADDLRYPWAAALASLEASTPEGVQWLSFELAGKGGELRLEGAAPAAEAALRVVDSFAARPGWRGVALLRLERGAGANGAPPFRFSVEARLDPVALARAADPSSP